MRLDYAILDSLAGMRLARVALDARAQSDHDRVPGLFTEDELPYRNGFSVSVGVARHRLADAEAQLALNAFPIYVSGFDDLLGGVIRMLRQIGIANSAAAIRAETGVADKLEFLRAHAAVRLHPPYEHLYELLVQVRNSVVHGRADAQRAERIWNRGGGAPEEARSIWEELASRPFPEPRNTGELDLGDREIVGCQRLLDKLGLDLARALRARISPLDWARLVAAEFGPSHTGILSDPKRGPTKLRAWARSEWQVEVTIEDAEAAIKLPLED